MMSRCEDKNIGWNGVRLKEGSKGLEPWRDLIKVGNNLNNAGKR